MFGWEIEYTILALGCVLLFRITHRALVSLKSHPSPPGPPGIPWVGNVIGVDFAAPWKTYAEWAKTYGDIIYTRLLGRNIIIVNSEKIAKDLIEKRSTNYSDRPNLVAFELYGLDFFSVFLPYGNRWRMHRHFFNQTFRPDAISRFLPLQHQTACHLLRQLLATPEQLDAHVIEHATSVILGGIYDYSSSSSQEDEIAHLIKNFLDTVLPAIRLDAAIVCSTFPFLLHLPSWLPGVSFKREMMVANAYVKGYLERPFKYSLHRLETLRDHAAPSMIQDGLRYIEDKKNVSQESDSWKQALKEAAGFGLLAASESSHSVLMRFFLMIMLNQSTQEKAQAQIDAVVGKTRLPSIEDRPLLPYVDAIFRETLRYNPIGPLSIPYAAVEDDVYEGFHIPKGAIILTNLWSMANDESKYPNPNAFIPDRFLNEDGSLKPNDIEHIAFGFGRRMCSGKHFADTSAWMVIAKVLAAFKILKPLDESGAEIPVEPRFSSGLAVNPLPFKCRIVPRFLGMDSVNLEDLIAASTP